VAIYRYLLGDFSPYLYRTDDYGKSWTKLTDGKNGIAADEPTRVIREDPVRPGLLYAGTEFGLYASFDNGAHWQSLQMNLPASPVTDIRLAHGDLVLSTQGRGFWILDNVGVLRQLPPAGEAKQASRLYTPATAIRINAFADRGPNPAEGPEYVLPGAQIDYFVASSAAGRPVTLTIRDPSGRVVRKFASSKDAAKGAGQEGNDGLGTYRPRYQMALDARAGMHRFIWDLRYASQPDGVQPASKGRGLSGPVAPPGNYTVEMDIGGTIARQPLTIVEDPRITASGVTQADLQEQFDHNMRVLALVNEANLDAARLKRATDDLKTHSDPAKEKALKAVADMLLTPPIRYSQPGLQEHVQYLYGETNGADQKVGRDAIERYAELRPQIAAITAELNRLLGPVKTAELSELRLSGFEMQAAANENEEDEEN
jgi:hypothetical protein